MPVRKANMPACSRFANITPRAAKRIAMSVSFRHQLTEQTLPARSWPDSRSSPSRCLKDGDIDLADLRAKADAHADDLAALMVTYPSTHGVFETTIREICEIVHEHGGQVYMDGANMNAQVGLCRPGDYRRGRLPSQFAQNFLHPARRRRAGRRSDRRGQASRSISSAACRRFGLKHQTINDPVGPGRGCALRQRKHSHHLMDVHPHDGRRRPERATEVAILNANYIAKRLDTYFPVLFKGKHGLVAHECILDLAPMEERRHRSGRCGQAVDGLRISCANGFVAGRRNDDGRADRERIEGRAGSFLRCDDLHSRRKSTRSRIGNADQTKQRFEKRAAHRRQIAADKWEHPYSREQAAYPAPWTARSQILAGVARIDNVYGDRNLVLLLRPARGTRRFKRIKLNSSPLPGMTGGNRAEFQPGSAGREPVQFGC